MTIVKGTREFDKAPTVNGANVLDANSVLDDLSNVSVAAPSVGDRLEWNGSTWVPVSGTQQDSVGDIAGASNEITTTSSSYILAASMSLTPASGTYLVWFTGENRHSSENNITDTAIYSGGTLVAESEREYKENDTDPGGSGSWQSFASGAKVTVNGSEAIEGRYRESGSGTAYLRCRQLMILKVA